MAYNPVARGVGG